MENCVAPVSFRIADLALLRGADFLSVFDPSQRQALAIFPLAPMKKEDAPTPELAEAWCYSNLSPTIGGAHTRWIALVVKLLGARGVALK